MDLAMRLRILLISTLALLGLQLRAQSDASQTTPHLIKFEEETHDFGIRDQGVKTETVFKFKNTSQVPVKLTNVKAACGCTTPEWSKDEIKPGAIGEISVSYNSERVGVFTKSIAVNYNDRTDPITIFIKGQIMGKPDAAISAPNIMPDALSKPPQGGLSTINYSVIRGALAFEKVIENVKAFTSEENLEAEFKFRNTSSLPVRILKDKTVTDPAITVVFKDEVLKPGMETSVKLQINGQKMKESGQVDGYIAKNIAFFTDEASLNKKELTVNGNFKRVFSEAERNNSPHIVFENPSIEGGRIIEGENYVYDFKFKNTGNAPLTIISAKASCGCTAITPIVERIAPGESGAITATFNSKGRAGMQSKSITVTTNDIENPTLGLRFTVEVVKDPFHAAGVVEQQ
jgi:Protein of unknown function (DUF1573)